MRFGFREIIFIMLLLGIPVAAYFLVFEKRNAEIAELKSDVARKQADLAELEAATKQFSDLDQEIQKLSDAVEIFEDKLPEEQEVEVVLKEVSNLTDRHDLRIKSIRPDKVTRNAHYSEKPLKMVILGDFDSYYEFLLDLEKLRRITRMPDMKLKKLKSEEEGMMEAEIVLKIYFDSNKQVASAQ